MNDLPTVTKPVKRKASKPKKSTIVEKPKADKVVTTVPKTDQMPVETVSIEIPLATIAHGPDIRRCDVKGISPVGRLNHRDFFNGLVAKQEKLLNGQPVRTRQDAIKWILENLRKIG